MNACIHVSESAVSSEVIKRWQEYPWCCSSYFKYKTNNNFPFSHANLHCLFQPEYLRNLALVKLYAGFQVYWFVTPERNIWTKTGNVQRDQVVGGKPKTLYCGEYFLEQIMQLAVYHHGVRLTEASSCFAC